MKKLIILTFFILSFTSAWTQDKYFTRTGEINFYSDAPMEKIEALNQQVSCILDMASGNIAVSLQMRGFKFEKALMEEHFNENYVESHKFPKATFKGQITDYENAELTKKGMHDVLVKGELTIHGVTHPVETTGTIQTTDKGFNLSSAFDINLDDYKIEIPSAVTGKIAENVEIKLDMALAPYSN